MYQNLSAEEDNKKLKCGRERYNFFFEKGKKCQYKHKHYDDKISLEIKKTC